MGNCQGTPGASGMGSNLDAGQRHVENLECDPLLVVVSASSATNKGGEKVSKQKNGQLHAPKQKSVEGSLPMEM